MCVTSDSEIMPFKAHNDPLNGARDTWFQNKKYISVYICNILFHILNGCLYNINIIYYKYFLFFFILDLIYLYIVQGIIGCRNL